MWVPSKNGSEVPFSTNIGKSETSISIVLKSDHEKKTF